MVAAVQLNLSPLGLTANERDRNVPHGRIGLGAMPMALASLDVCHIADVDLALLMLRRHDAGARSHDRDLVAIVDMPSCVAALAEVHHGAVVVLGVAGLDDGLACPTYRAGAFGIFSRVKTFMTRVSIGLRSARDRTTIRSPVAGFTQPLPPASPLDVRARCFATLIELASRRFGFACTRLTGCPGSFYDPAQPWVAMSTMMPESTTRRCADRMKGRND